MKFIKQLKALMLKGNFFRNVSILVSGTAISLIVIVLTTPLLTRLYTPEEFGGYSIYVSILYTTSVMASLLYESAIPLPRDEDDAVNLLSLSLIIVSGMSVLCLMGVWLFRHSVASIVNIPHLEEYLWLLPLSLFGFGIFQVLNTWLIRREAYPFMAKGKVFMNMSQVFSQIGLGLLQFGPVGLVMGEVVGRVVGSGTVLRLSFESIKARFHTITLKKMRDLANRYKYFPLISSWSSILSVASGHLPVFFIAASFGSKAAGLYMLGQRVLSIPDALIGFSVKQVYFASATKQIRSTTTPLNTLFWQMVWKLSGISFLVICIIVLAAPWTFGHVFGESWIESGTYIQVMAILFFFQMVVNPITANFFVFEAQNLQLIGEIIRFGLLLLAVLVSTHSQFSSIQSLLCLSVLGSAGYLVVAFLAWYAMRTKGVKQDQFECEIGVEASEAK
ncbi:lipopolysaccharide biosynthesis protein [Rossellomorea sp. NPDC077527]|uniref:lipopolysaccharide biosynthesis protein n=1 Tax=Rossellomorea sp. NPDC077527 TaxID=3364510 RepID=UPI0037C65736